jgi:hypothetical protein
MHVRWLILSVCLSYVSQAPVVMAGTRGVVEEPARVEGELCKGWDGHWYRRGARECLPPETAGTQEETDATQASEGPGGQGQPLFLAVVVAIVAFAAAAIAAGLRNSRRASTSEEAPEAPPPDRAAQSPRDQPEMGPPVLSSVLPLSSEDISASPAPSDSEDVHEQPAPVHGEAGLVTVWTGAPCTVEFTCRDQDGDWHRNRVDITRILRDPRDGGWHLHGFCHLWREERDYDGASIVTKILYKSRRWTLEDWITAVAGEEARGS